MQTVTGDGAEAPRKIAPKGAGTIHWVPAKPGETQGHYMGRISLIDGARPWVHCPPGPRSVQAEARAREYVASKAERARLNRITGEEWGLKPRGVTKETTTGSRPAVEGETVSDFADRWLKARVGRVASVRDNKGHLNEHILPVIGPLAISAVRSKDIEDVVAALDRKVLAGEMSAKTAKNVWGTCSKMFDDATHAKPSAGLRCLTTDPTDGVRGPDDDEADKVLQFLYPSEVSTFVACDDVPVTWRRNVAIAVYLCLRDGEQRALKWSAVDLAHGIVTVCETFDRRKGEDREGTKSGAARVVPIRTELLPLLRAMRAESRTRLDDDMPNATSEVRERAVGGKLVCDLPSLRDMARGLRRWLKKAGVDRIQLHEGTTVSKVLRWHDTRSTGLTWYAVEGRSSTEIRDIAGHTQTSMTDRYMRAAGILRGGRFGQPFPTLPTSLCDAPKLSVDSLKARNARQVLDIVAGRTGLEPAASGVTGRRYNQLNYRPKRFSCVLYSVTYCASTLSRQVLPVGGTGLEPATSGV